MEQKPHKKDELMVANSVLKLAEDLLKVEALNFFATSLEQVFTCYLFSLKELVHCSYIDTSGRQRLL